MLYFLEIVFICFMFAIIITQIAIPTLRGTVLFPFFRKERQLEKQLHSVKQDVIEGELIEEIETLKNKKREEKKPNLNVVDIDPEEITEEKK